jgi:hypothetical protein
MTAGQPSDDAVERLGEALFVLSDRLRASGVLSASDPVHQAYEGVVAAFQPLAAMQSTDTEAVIVEAIEAAALVLSPAYHATRDELADAHEKAKAARAKLKERGH